MTTLKIDELMLECKRQGIKITQKDLAEAAGIGQTAIHKIIRGDTQAPKPQILVAIADYFTEALARKITVDDLIVRSETHGTEDDSLPRAVETSRSPFGATDWMQVNEGGPVTDGHFISVPILGNIPHGDLDQVGPEDIVGYEHVHKRELGRGDSFSVPEATPWHPSSSTAISSSSSQDPSGSTKPSSRSTWTGT